jgi:hypothetical protein
MPKSLSTKAINLNSITALAFAANFFVTVLHFNLEPNFEVASILTLCVIPVYQFVKFQKMHHSLAIALVGATLLLPFFITSCSLLLTIAVAAFLTISYNTFHRFSWRTNPFLKVAVVALVWTLMSVLIPFLLENAEIGFTYLSLRFLLFCVQILLFEIADLPTDKGRIQSVPQLMSVPFLKTILALTAFTALFFLEENLFISFTLSAYMLFLIVRIAPGNRRFADVFVEAFPILYLFLKGVEFL